MTSDPSRRGPAPAPSRFLRVIAAGHPLRGRRSLRWAALLAVVALLVGLYGAWPRNGRTPTPVAAGPTATASRSSAPPAGAVAPMPLDGPAPGELIDPSLDDPGSVPGLISRPNGPTATFHSCVVQRGLAPDQPAATPSPQLPRAATAVVLHVPVLTYHVIAPWSVARPYSLASLDVTPEVFATQLRGLRQQGWRTITVAALAQLLATGGRPDPKTFVITIDDGHRDGYTYALPVLQADGFVATFYVVAGRVGAGSYLSWDEIRTLRADGMEIGNHTVDHVPLVGLSAASLACEVTDAQALFRDELGTAPSTFAYPFGRFDAAAAAAVDAAGLLVAVTTDPGRSESWSGRLALPRIHVGPAATAERLLKLFAGFG